MSAAPTAPSTSNPMLALLDFVASPIVLFNADGQAVFSNQAAQMMRCQPGMLLGSNPHVRGLVRDVAAGKTVPHLDLRLDAASDNGTARLQCRCAPGSIAGLVAMSITELAPELAGTDPQSPPGSDQRLSMQEIMELIKADLMPPMQQVLAQTSPTEHRGLAHSVALLSERLERLSDLVKVFGDDLLIGEERLLVPDMVRSIAQDLAPLTRSRGVSFAIEGDREDLPPVYGSRRLLQRALHECLHNAVRHAREGVRSTEGVAVGIRFCATDSHLQVHIHNIGVLSAAALTRHAAAIFQPSDPANNTTAEQTDRLRIGLPLTQRILQQHGGRMRIEQVTANELDVLLELPTSAPLRNTHQLDLLQAQSHAEDLSSLVARTRQHSQT